MRSPPCSRAWVQSSARLRAGAGYPRLFGALLAEARAALPGATELRVDRQPAIGFFWRCSCSMLGTPLPPGTATRSAPNTPRFTRNERATSRWGGARHARSPGDLLLVASRSWPARASSGAIRSGAAATSRSAPTSPARSSPPTPSTPRASPRARARRRNETGVTLALTEGIAGGVRRLRRGPRRAERGADPRERDRRGEPTGCPRARHRRAPSAAWRPSRAPRASSSPPRATGRATREAHRLLGRPDAKERRSTSTPPACPAATNSWLDRRRRRRRDRVLATFLPLQCTIGPLPDDLGIEVARRADPIARDLRARHAAHRPRRAWSRTRR